jgi:hypothetical protein
MNSQQSKKPCCCSFCGKDHTDVSKLIAGPGVYICDECVIVCCEILAKELQEWPKHLRAPNDPIKVTYDMLLSMRDAGEIPGQVFTARLAEAVIREFTPARKPASKAKCKKADSRGNL